MSSYYPPPTIEYKGKVFFCTHLYVKNMILYKIKVDLQELYEMVQSGDALYQIYVRLGMKFVRKSDNLVVKIWDFT